MEVFGADALSQRCRAAAASGEDNARRGETLPSNPERINGCGSTSIVAVLQVVGAARRRPR
jgi:hypothetical protein